MFGRFFSKNAQEENTTTEAPPPDGSQNTLSNLSAEKLKSVIVSLNNAEPIFQAAGYIMEQLDVEFGSQPKLTPRFRQQAQINEAQQQEVLELVKEQQLIKFILISLFKSGRMQSLFEDSELYFYGMEIDISSIPSVRTVFRRKESIAEVIPLNKS